MGESEIRERIRACLYALHGDLVMRIQDSTPWRDAGLDSRDLVELGWVLSYELDIHLDEATLLRMGNPSIDTLTSLVLERFREAKVA